MRIGINGYEAVVPRFGYDSKTGLPNRVGSGKYCFELLLNLKNLDKENEYFIYLPTKPTEDLPKESSNWHYKISGPRRLWTALGLSFDFFLKKPKLNVFFSPTHYLPIFVPYPSIISVLDLSYIHFPYLFKKSDLLQLKLWTGYSVRKARKVLTISQASKDDIIKTYKVPEDRIVVTYPGIKSEIRNPKSETNSKFKMQSSTHSTGSGLMLSEVEASKLLKDKYGIEGDYILFVGTLQPRKNIVRLIEAFSHVKRDSSLKAQNDISLIVVGKKGWMYEEILKAPKVYKVEERVRFLDFVSAEDLPLFYENALCFVLPSLYEGFGLPVLEAMQNGCPVITSNVSSLPEAGGDAALYVDPLNVDDIAAKINKVLTDEKLRKELVEKGYQQVKKFSWEKTARETLKALQEVAKER